MAVKKRKRRAVHVAAAGENGAGINPPMELHQGPGVIRPEQQKVVVRDYNDDSRDWRPGRVVCTVVILGVIFILIIAWLIFRGYGAAG